MAGVGGAVQTGFPLYAQCPWDQNETQGKLDHTSYT